MNNDTLLKFPCLFSIKIMGLNHPNLISEVTAIISRHTSHFNSKTDITSKLSTQKNYVSLTATIMANSKQQLDTIYTQLNKNELVKVVL